MSTDLAPVQTAADVDPAPDLVAAAELELLAHDLDQLATRYTARVEALGAPLANVATRQVARTAERIRHHAQVLRADAEVDA